MTGDSIVVAAYYVEKNNHNLFAYVRGFLRYPLPLYNSGITVVENNLLFSE